MRKYRWKFFNADKLRECMLDEFSMGVVYFIIRIHVGTALVQHFLRTNLYLQRIQTLHTSAYSNAAYIKYLSVIRINTISAVVRI